MSIDDRPAPGAARSPGISYQELLDTDTHEVPSSLREESSGYFGSDDMSVERYTSRAWHDKEVEHVWSRAWQFACREEHVPDVGDYVVYEIARSAFVVMRTAPDTIKAYWNSCLHRGPTVEGLRRSLRPRTAVPVPRLRLGTRRHLQARSRRLGLLDAGRPRRRGVISNCPRRWLPDGRASCSSTPTWTLHRSRSGSAVGSTTSNGGTSAAATWKLTWPRSSSATGKISQEAFLRGLPR